MKSIFLKQKTLSFFQKTYLTKLEGRNVPVVVDRLVYMLKSKILSSAPAIVEAECETLFFRSAFSRQE